MVDYVHWATRIITLFWSALVTGHTPTPAPVQTECVTAVECTIVRDTCGRPFGRPLTNPVAPPAPQLCPPANYAVTEPMCGSGRCEAIVVSTPNLRSCSQDTDCMAMNWVCGGWWAIARAQQSAAQQHVNQVARTRSCQAQTASVAPPVACLESTCVVRAPSIP